MNIQRWIARKEANWKRLNKLLQQAEKKGLQSLKASEIQELASLYRSVSADLARAKTYKVGDILVKDLQKLTSRSYNQIYQGSRHQEWLGVIDFYRWGLPNIIQQTWIYTAIATAVFMLGGVIAWWYAWLDQSFLTLMVPPDLIIQVRDKQELWMGSIVGVEPLASSNIMVNNLSVAFKTVAGGVSLGIFTLYILFFNGLHIGAIAALVGQNNLAYGLWAFVFPHGALELPAIFFAGGAGLLIARGILFPGKYRRSEAIKFYGSQAAKLVFGIIPLLIIAGIIEGFFSPSPIIPSFIKYLAGIFIFTLLIRYCNRTNHERVGEWGSGGVGE